MGALCPDLFGDYLRLCTPIKMLSLITLGLSLSGLSIAATWDTTAKPAVTRRSTMRSHRARSASHKIGILATVGQIHLPA